ncbi:hypothetical protein LJB95_00040 [Paludibacteraceae bacterium OttesenSCG-928-F17]|nr:hypothetical protein [Paludibacteraceae bacterium OttesenSCG-928-F17]
MKKRKGCLIAVCICLFLLVTTIGVGVTTEWGMKGKPKLPEYEVIENKKHDVPFKSQISLRVSLTNTTDIDTLQVRDLLHSLVKTATEVKMKYHNPPTNVYVYIYKTKSDYEADGASWLMMYAKNFSDEEGKYTYEPLLSNRR